MRILQVNLEHGWRGGERQTMLTLLGLRQLGHDAQLLARAASPLAQRAHAAGITTHACSGSLAAVWFLWHSRRRFEIWHAQTAQAMSLLALQRGGLSGGIVFTRRTAFAARDGAALRRWKWSRADALVTISQAAAQAPRALGLPVQVIPSAVERTPPDVGRVATLRQHYALRGRKVLVTAAALSPEKDPVTLIEAVALLRDAHPDILCLHCGAEGAAAAAARARIAALDLQAHYQLVGFQPHVGEFLELADVYASSSRFEALGTSVLDACLAGVPVVATQVGGHPEILAPDRGLLVPAGDAQALARRMAWVLEHPEPAQAMALRAQAFVAQEFAVPVMVKRYEALYQGLLAQ